MAFWNRISEERPRGASRFSVGSGAPQDLRNQRRRTPVFQEKQLVGQWQIPELRPRVQAGKPITHTNQSSGMF
jgi:hypothetical protein